MEVKIYDFNEMVIRIKENKHFLRLKEKNLISKINLDEYEMRIMILALYIKIKTQFCLIVYVDSSQILLK